NVLSRDSPHLSLDVPVTGFHSPTNTPSASYTVITANVTLPGISLNDNGASIGRNLQISDQLTLGAPAPSPNGVTVTITSNSPNLKLSLTATAAGVSSILIHIPAGQS